MVPGLPVPSVVPRPPWLQEPKRTPLAHANEGTAAGRTPHRILGPRGREGLSPAGSRAQAWHAEGGTQGTGLGLGRGCRRSPRPILQTREGKARPGGQLSKHLLWSAIWFMKK